MLPDRLAHLLRTHLEQRAIARTASCDQDVVDRAGQVVEESFNGAWVVGVEGGRAMGVHVAPRSRESFGISPGEDDVGAFSSGAAGGFEANTRASADQDHGLAEQFRLALGGNGSGCGGHESSDAWYRRPLTASSRAVLGSPTGSPSARSSVSAVAASRRSPCGAP